VFEPEVRSGKTKADAGAVPKDKVDDQKEAASPGKMDVQSKKPKGTSNENDGLWWKMHQGKPQHKVEPVKVSNSKVAAMTLMQSEVGDATKMYKVGDSIRHLINHKWLLGKVDHVYEDGCMRIMRHDGSLLA